MSFPDIVLLAAGNLWRRKLRTFLTILGVIIGTACIVIMVALGIGNLEQFNESVMQSADLTQIEIYNYSGMGGGQSATALNDSTIETFRAIPGVKSATGLIEVPSYIVMGKYTGSSAVYGVDPDAMDFDFMEGGVFSDTGSVELVIGAGARQFFTDPREAAGVYYASYGYAVESGEYEEPAGPDVEWLDQPLKYYPYWSDGKDEEFTPERPAPKEYKARISGILAQANDQQSYSMYMSMEAAGKLIRENKKLLEEMGVREGQYSLAYVNAADVNSVADALRQIKDMGFQAYSPTEWITQMQDEQVRQQSQLIAIGLISLFVSAIGIANTMLASILERRRELGVMKVIGLTINRINLMFLAEAAMIGLLGGAVGLAVSYAAGGFINTAGGQASFLGMYFSEGVRLSIPWWLGLGAIAIATGVGVVSGIYPAWQATKMSPLEAIRGGE
jgi:ABC-type antimicrobial peptide transport system permease subunit